MTNEELFTLMILKFGRPRELVIRRSAGMHGKAGPVGTTEHTNIDYICGFISLAASQNFMINSEKELVNLHKQFVQWHGYEEANLQKNMEPPSERQRNSIFR